MTAHQGGCASALDTTENKDIIVSFSERSSGPAMQQILHAALDEVRGAVRFRLPAIIAAWAICLLGWGLVLILPDVYQATARVFADHRTALAPVIQGLAIEQDVTAQLNLVEQSLLGDEL